MNNLTHILCSHYDYSLALRSQSETAIQETLTTAASTLVAYGYCLTARPLVLSPNIEDPWVEFR
ncbi:MAG: hypothetical protein B5766_01215 [Candidatus Lumbricidophila eiseniae]|uniref:Uncharacterized protein n=1 Tax=Candidatus Lumbricidiphila eiseniae TaxID=1969409 RepID=A0A2A6FTV7_9MICO|nr:MAG: hypothetical protein B5766_01215 [Candidatus Lumbricidophila eiseniae]